MKEGFEKNEHCLFGPQLQRYPEGHNRDFKSVTLANATILIDLIKIGSNKNEMKVKQGKESTLYVDN